MSCMCFYCVSERGQDSPEMPPDGWHIEKNPKPMPDGSYNWNFWHDDYDGANGLEGTAASWDDAVERCWDMECDWRYL